VAIRSWVIQSVPVDPNVGEVRSAEVPIAVTRYAVIQSVVCRGGMGAVQNVVILFAVQVVALSVAPNAVLTVVQDVAGGVVIQ